MYRIRFHGRGGQGMKTSSRILGTSFFYEGYEVQDAPKYGAERRGAPVSAYVRADKKSIYERGIIHNPDLVVISDDSLLDSIPEMLTEGLSDKSIILVNSTGNITEWKEKFNVISRIEYLTLHHDKSDHESALHLLSTACAAAAARLCGVISWSNLEKAIREEHFLLTESAMKENIETARYAYKELESSESRISEYEGELNFRDPDWVEMDLESSYLSTPSIRNTGTSLKNSTGSWRTIHPEIKQELCSRCSLCSVYCPDNAININEDGLPMINYGHCKGCLICVSVCPKHAIETETENSPFKRGHYRGKL